MPRPSSPKGGKSIIESALAPWIAARPDFLWIPTNSRTLMLDRANGVEAAATQGSVPAIGGPNNNLGGSSRCLTFPCGTRYQGYGNPFIAMALVGIEDPQNVTGAFLKIGGDASSGVGLGGGATDFDTTGNKVIGLLEGYSWKLGSANAFVKGLNLAYVAATWQSDLIQVGVINTGLITDSGNGGAWPTSGSVVTVGGYTPRGTNARVHAVAIFPMTGTSAEYQAFAQSRGADVAHLLGTPYEDITGLFKERSRRVWAVSGGGGLSLTGSLTGQGSTLSASATNTEVHAISGALVGAGATLSGTATRIYSLVGALTGQGATLSGSATTLELHAATGALVGAGSTLSATATNTEIHAATGSLIGSGSTLSGTATHTPLGINASGSLVGQGSTLSATATNTEVHTCTGALYGQGATLSGALTRVFSAFGSLVGAGSTLSATAGNAVAVFSATGSLVGQGSTLSATATNTETHAVSGSLVGQGSTLSATAALANLHTLSGSLVGSGSSLVGYASGPTTAFEASPDAIVTVINKRNRVSVISRRS